MSWIVLDTVPLIWNRLISMQILIISMHMSTLADYMEGLDQ